MHLPSGIVVGIEQISVLRVERRVIRQSFFDDEGFKKPTGVREMPFRRTHLGNSLDDAILRLKGLAKVFAQLSDATVGRVQVFRPFAWLTLVCFGRSSVRSYWKGRHDEEFRRKELGCQR